LLIGTNTAGRAMIAEAFKLSNGQQLHIARAGVRLGGGTTLSAEGVCPDIAVVVGAAEERVSWDDPLKEFGSGTSGPPFARTATNPAAAGTNRAGAGRMNEATLVRERSKGAGAPTAARTPAAGDPAPVIRDAALARALDLIKALALIQELHAR
jgi:hypothetical protein